ncbi:hypothetical protein N6H18_07670 [Reichenbachiella agarivorans]|uniref:DUF4848 domain-containing protein n=1 Tax=Reichenbachiella agarivorans TaxID=2979464 RepID=A0ABY6D008_9BACT|nr:hypothetical protein [Reichenbachiella agarivorans]UXP33825.1 hypothetical protein N6H18_07670 [Reichenbachiella agarivorans]
MKSTTYFKLPLYFVILLTIFSCSENDQLSNTLVSESYSLPESLKPKLCHENGILVFESIEQFEQISNNLMAESDRYYINYINGLGENLTEDEINDLMYENEFNPYLVFETFENYHGITSLRSELQARREVWLDNQELVGDDPSQYPISDRTLPFTNLEGEYIIGSTIMHIESSGLGYEILNKDFEALDRVRSGSFKLSEDTRSGVRLSSNVIVHNPEVMQNKNARSLASCQIYADANGTYKNHDDSNYKLFWRLNSSYDGLHTTIQAKVYVERKKYGVWRPYMTSLEAYFTANVYNPETCNLHGEYNDYTNRSWALYATAQKQFLLGIKSVKSGEFKGIFNSGKHDEIVRVYGVDSGYSTHR